MSDSVNIGIILKQKAKEGIEVKLVYDDIGCMSTLPGDYYKRLKKYNIETVLFSKLKGKAGNGKPKSKCPKEISPLTFFYPGLVPGYISLSPQMLHI